MAVYPDRIVLKNSTDPDGDIRSAIGVGGSDEIFYGEIVLGLGPGNAKLYTRDAQDNIVAFGGSNSESAGGLEDVDLAGLEDLDLLQWIASENKFRPRSVREAGALTTLSDDTAPALGGNIDVSGFSFVSTNESGALDIIDHGYIARYVSLQIPNDAEAQTFGTIAIGNTTIASPSGTGLTFNLPSDSGVANYALITDGNGNLSWSSGVAADISGSPWEALSNISLTGDSSKATWTVSNSLGASTAIFKPVPTAESFNANQGFEMRDGNWVRLNGPRASNDSFPPYISAGSSSITLKGASSGTMSFNGRLAYDLVSPSRLTSRQVTTFADLDSLESGLNQSIENIAIGDLSDVDLVTIPPVTGQTLVYSATGGGGTGSWVSASLPGTGTVTSVDLTNAGGLFITGGPVTDNGSISIGLETVSTISPGNYPFADVSVDEYGRIIEIASGGNGAGLVTSVNGKSGDVILSLYDLSDVRGVPAEPPNQSPDVESSWAFQCFGTETVQGPGRWKARVVSGQPSVSTLTFSTLDADSISYLSELANVVAAFNSNQDQYFQLTYEEFQYNPVLIGSISVDLDVATINFSSSDLNVGLFNGGDTDQSTPNVISKTLAIAVGPRNSFSFDFDGASPGQFMRWSSDSFFEPHTLYLSDSADVSGNNPGAGQFLRWNQNSQEWAPSSTVLADATDVSSAPPSNGQALTWNGTTWEPGTAGTFIEWNLTANGTSSYIISGPGFPSNGSENPDIYLIRGEEYRFTNLMGIHPFRIQTTPTRSGASYNEGISVNPIVAGTMEWVVRMDAPSVLYYQCTVHEDMNGVIYIFDPGASVTEINDLSDVDTATVAPVADQALIWNGSSWIPGNLPESAATIVSSDAPTTRSDGSALEEGDLWWDSSTGALHVYYQSAWFEVSGGDGSGGTGLITVQERAGLEGRPQNPATGISTLSFNTNNGFSVTDLGNGEALVNLGSAFAPWHVEGQTTLDPEGEEPVEFVAGAGIEITTNAAADPKQIIFTSTGGGGGGGGGTTTQRSSQSLTSDATGLLAFDQLGFSGTLVSITSSVDAWVVLYESQSSRTSDASRLFTQDPAPGSGVLAEMYVLAGQSVTATPGTTYFNNDATLTEALYVSVRNQQGQGISSTVEITAYADKVITIISGGTFGSG